MSVSSDVHVQKYILCRSMKNSVLQHEQQLWQSGKQFVCGVDEVGRGAYAGPVVVGAVLFSPTVTLEALRGITDSKLLTHQQREAILPNIQKIAQSHAVGVASVEEIDSIGLSEALHLALARAIAHLSCTPEYILSDANLMKSSGQHTLFSDNFIAQTLGGIPFSCFKKGELVSVSIAAASIVAKVYRDNILVALGEEFPEYRFAEHKGYGTEKHVEALKQYGVTCHHRKSFKPIALTITPPAQ